MDFGELIEDAARSKASLSEVVSREILGGDPFVFREKPGVFAEFTEYFSSAFEVSVEAITIVGSGKLGFSLNPKHPGSAFDHEASDIDVVICDEKLFDSYWNNLLSWRYPWHISKWTTGDQRWGSKILENFFAGHIQPHGIRYVPTGRNEFRRKLQKMGNSWFDAFQQTALIPALGGYDYKGRLYRTWAHAAKYHEDGLRLLIRNEVE